MFKRPYPNAHHRKITSTTGRINKVLTVSHPHKKFVNLQKMVTIVLDNGASTIKVGIVNKDEQPRLV